MTGIWEFSATLEEWIEQESLVAFFSGEQGGDSQQNSASEETVGSEENLDSQNQEKLALAVAQTSRSRKREPESFPLLTGERLEGLKADPDFGESINPGEFTLSNTSTTTDLLISEYVEGSSNNKAIEVFNGTGATIDLAADQYALEFYFNGNTSAGTIISLDGTIADGDVFVVADNDADSAILNVADQTSTSNFFNGDDAVVLKRGDTILDAIGEIGFDPGSEWGSGDTSTQNNTLRRQSDITAGDSDPFDAFDPALEWDGFPQDTFDGLGSHQVGVSAPLINEFVFNHTGTDAYEYIEIFGTANTDYTTYTALVLEGDSGSNEGTITATFSLGTTDAAGYWTTGFLNSALQNGTQTLLLVENFTGSAGDDLDSNDDGTLDSLPWDTLIDDVAVTDGGSSDLTYTSTVLAPGFDGISFTPGGASRIPNGTDTDTTDDWLRNDFDGAGIPDLDPGTPESGEAVNTPDAENQAVSSDGGSTSPGWVINEIHADPASDLSGDANGDGTRDSGDDEFAELVNNTGAEVDISGWTISDGVGVRHTFPSGTLVPDQGAVVVFGGGTPNGSFGDAIVQTASGGLLGFNNSGDTVTLNDGTTDLATYTYGSEGGNNQSLTRDPDISGSEPLVLHSNATGSGNSLFSPGTLVDGSNFPGSSASEPTTVPIYEIQGSGDTSPLVGQTVTTEGVVVGDFQGADELRGFFIQDPTGDGDVQTSDGVFVFVPEANPFFGTEVQVGDLVRVTAEVKEFNTLTELDFVSELEIIGSGSVAPTAVTLPETTNGELEQYEGMAVEINSTMTVSQNFFLGRYGQMTLASPDDAGNPGRLFQPTNLFRPLTTEAVALAEENARRLLVLDDGQDIDPLGDNPDPVPYIGPPPPQVIRAGDRVSNLIGVLDQGRINSNQSNPDLDYRLHPTAAPSFSATNPRTTEPDPVGGTLQVGSFNVLNYFNGDGTGGGFPTSRGADTASEFERQRDKIIAAITSIDAEVLGLVEIENDGYDSTSAIQDLVNGLNAVVGAGTYDFVDPGTSDFGGDEIAVGFIYQPAEVRVAPGTTVATLDTGEFTQGSDRRHRQPMAVTFEEIASGETFTAVVNHFKSKGSLTGIPEDEDQGDGQGNNNFSRTNAANELTQWLATDPTGSGDPDFMILGDLNAYGEEDPIIAIEDAGYSNLVEQFVGTQGYSFTFDGQAGYLDHALSTDGLTTQVTGATEWHINTDEPAVIDYNEEFNPPGYYSPDPYRSSDHDPVLVGLDLAYAISGTSTRDSITGTSDDDIITAGFEQDAIATGAGNDRVVYTGLRDAMDIITDFEVGNDQIVLAGLLASVGYNGSDPFGDGYAQVTQGSDYAGLQINPDPGNPRSYFQTLALFEGVTATELNSNLESTFVI